MIQPLQKSRSNIILNGFFNGNYHKLINLKVKETLNYNETESGNIGLFATNNGQIKNLKLIMNAELTINSPKWYIGIGLLCGGSYPSSIIENCETTGNIKVSISGYACNLGGLIGGNNGFLKNCVSNVDLQIESSLTDELRFGGIVGVNENTGTIKNCYNNGTIQINVIKCLKCYIGGIVGRINSTSISNVYNLGKINDITSDYTNLSKELIDCCGSISSVDGVVVSGLNKAFTLNNLIETKNQSAVLPKNATIIDASELQGSKGVALLNDNNDTPIWVEDKNNINNGYPILNWQAENN